MTPVWPSVGASPAKTLSGVKNLGLLKFRERIKDGDTTECRETARRGITLLMMSRRWSLEKI